MPNVSKEEIASAREMDLLTYLSEVSLRSISV